MNEKKKKILYQSQNNNIFVCAYISLDDKSKKKKNKNKKHKQFDRYTLTDALIERSTMYVSSASLLIFP